jgi:hypothetical protein
MKSLSVLLFVSGLFLAQDPQLITIEYDDFAGYGTAPLAAISALWPSCVIYAFNGDPSGWADSVDSNCNDVGHEHDDCDCLVG